jgi:aspartyl protease family protein
MDQGSGNNQTAPKQIGRRFAFIFWGLFLFIAYQFFDAQLSKQHNPNQRPDAYREGGQTVLVLQRNKYGHYVTNGQINGQTVTFLLDTGATNVSIPQPIAERLNLPFGREVQTYTANGIGRSYLTSIERLSLDDINLYDVKASIATNMPGDQILLGMSALKQLEFSQRGDQLTLKTLN